MKQAITVQGSSLPVTVNLRTAFRYLGMQDKSRGIWADAVRVNQLDLDERSSQVSLVVDIYRRAMEVQVWLCKEDDVIPKEILDTSELALHPFNPELFNNWLEDGNLSKSLLPLEATGGALSLPTITYAVDILRLFADGKHRHEMSFLHITTSLKTSRLLLGTRFYM